MQASAILNDFKGQDPSLEGSSESNFLEGTIEALKKKDISIYEQAFNQYRTTNTASYDEWKKSVFNKIYKLFNTTNEGNIKQDDKNNDLEDPDFT